MSMVVSAKCNRSLGPFPSVKAYENSAVGFHSHVGLKEWHKCHLQKTLCIYLQNL